jgi:predicted outer membrane repeat protein
MKNKNKRNFILSLILLTNSITICIAKAEENPIAEINGITYNSIKEAVEVAQANETIKLLQDVSENVIIDKDLTLDLNNYTLTASEGTAISTVGAVTIENGCINNAINGAIDAQGDTTVTNVKFNDNQRSKSTEDGGAIRISNGTLTVNDCEFNNNSANDGGGAIATDKDSYLVVNSSTFNSNYANEGGAIYFNYGTGELHNCTFESNYTRDDTNFSTGGALYVGTNLTVTIDGSYFASNSASQGGAIVNYGGSLEISNTTLEKNTAAYGGAIYTYGFKNSNINIIDSEILNNTSTYYAGGIYSYTANTSISNSIISDNSTGYDGGAGYFYVGTFALSNSTISNNSAERYGGGFSNYVATNVTNNSLVANNTAGKAGDDIYGWGAYTIENSPNGTSLNSCGDAIDGYYYDNADARWNADGEATNVAEIPYTAEQAQKGYGIKAAHNINTTYTVKYVDKDSNNSIGEDKVSEKMKVGTVIIESPIEIKGYTTSDEKVELTLDKDSANNVITFYYEKEEEVVPTIEPSDSPTPTSTPKTDTKIVVEKETAIKTEVKEIEKPYVVTIPVATSTGTIVNNYYYNYNAEVVQEDAEEVAASPSLSAETETIIDEDLPMGADSGEGEGHWALVNLICVIVLILSCIISAFSKAEKEEEDEDGNEEEYSRKITWRIVSILIAVLSVFIFIFTENMYYPMQLTDNWTLLMLVLAILNFIPIYLASIWHEEDDSEEDE